MTDVQQHAGDPRVELANQLRFLHEWLRHVESLSQQRIAVERRYERFAPLKRKWGIVAFLLWTVGSVITLTAIASPLFQADIDAAAEKAHAIAVPQVDPQIVAQLSIPFALVIAVLAVILYNTVFLRRRQTKIATANDARQARNDLVAADEKAVYGQLAQASADYARYVGASFPKNYLYEDAVGFFVKMVNDHRANTLQEAINLYETQLHRNRMENLAQANLAEARRTNQLVAVGNVINAMGHAATVNRIRAEGAATRSAAAANAARVTEQLRKPRTVFVKRR